MRLRRNDIGKPTCPICQNMGDPHAVSSCHYGSRGRLAEVSCRRCGHFVIEKPEFEQLTANPIAFEQAALAAGWIRENEPPLLLPMVISPGKIAILRTLPPPSASEKAQKLFWYIAKRFPQHGDWFQVDSSEGEYLGAAWATLTEEAHFLLSEYVIKRWQLIERSPQEHLDEVGFNEYWVMTLRITPDGWDLVEHREEPRSTSRPIGFR